MKVISNASTMSNASPLSSRAQRLTALRKRTRAGQGVTEYIVVLLIVAIASISLITSSGSSVKTMWTNTKNALSTAAKTTP